ncbi:MAG: hypothetical protein QW146_07125 [Candidatus Bathyarchaeia archaeon]
MVLGGAAAAGAAIGVKKSIERKLRRKGALSEETAVMPEEAEITKRELRWVTHLIEKGKVGKTEDGKIWWKE